MYLSIAALRGVSRSPLRDCERVLAGLPDHLVRLEEERRYRQAKRRSGLEVDDQLEHGRLLDGQVGWLGRKQALPSHRLV